MIQRRRTPLSILGSISALLLILGCAQGPKTQGGKIVFMAGTIGPIDSGIVDVLENEFEKETGIRARHVGAGTGAALKIAEKENI